MTEENRLSAKEKLAELQQQIVQTFKTRKIDIPYWNRNFNHFSRWASHITGRALAFNLAMIIIMVWVISGPIFGFSDTWQLIINTATTIVTFLMVFLIQHTQNRDTQAMHSKLDELIRSVESARKEFLNLEDLEDEDFQKFKEEHETPENPNDA
ncbi:MAG: low affinity iron permease family protein [Gammaproteobacteria bacterium]